MPGDKGYYPYFFPPGQGLSRTVVDSFVSAVCTLETKNGLYTFCCIFLSIHFCDFARCCLFWCVRLFLYDVRMCLTLGELIRGCACGGSGDGKEV